MSGEHIDHSTAELMEKLRKFSLRRYSCESISNATHRINRVLQYIPRCLNTIIDRRISWWNLNDQHFRGLPKCKGNRSDKH